MDQRSTQGISENCVAFPLFTQEEPLKNCYWRRRRSCPSSKNKLDKKKKSMQRSSRPQQGRRNRMESDRHMKFNEDPWRRVRPCQAYQVKIQRGKSLFKHVRVDICLKAATWRSNYRTPWRWSCVQQQHNEGQKCFIRRASCNRDLSFSSERHHSLTFTDVLGTNIGRLMPFVAFSRIPAPGIKALFDLGSGLAHQPFAAAYRAPIKARYEGLAILRTSIYLPYFCALCHASKKKHVLQLFFFSFVGLDKEKK